MPSKIWRFRKKRTLLKFIIMILSVICRLDAKQLFLTLKANEDNGAWYCLLLLYEEGKEELRTIPYIPLELLVINYGARAKADNSAIVLYGMTSIDEVSVPLCGAVCWIGYDCLLKFPQLSKWYRGSFWYLLVLNKLFHKWDKSFLLKTLRSAVDCRGNWDFIY